MGVGCERRRGDGFDEYFCRWIWGLVKRVLSNRNSSLSLADAIYGVGGCLSSDPVAGSSLDNARNDCAVSDNDGFWVDAAGLCSLDVCKSVA